MGIMGMEGGFWVGGVGDKCGRWQRVIIHSLLNAIEYTTTTTLGTVKGSESISFDHIGHQPHHFALCTLPFCSTLSLLLLSYTPKP